jgi:protein-tyrosine phosphatase
MIDLHSHILYDLDDGALTIHESLAMAQMAAEDGVRVIAATPHSPASTASRAYSPALIRERIDQVNAALAAEGLPIEVVAGTEIAFEPGVVERLRRGEVLAYGRSRAILLELARNMFVPSFEDVVFALQIAGYRVVLAHPERIVEVQHDPNRLLPLIERGVLMQITAEALIGKQGELLRATAETLLMHGMAHVIASDAHGVPPRRSPRLAAARERAAELIGGEAAQALVTAVPAALLYDQPLRLAPPRPVTQRHGRWRRHGV